MKTDFEARPAFVRLEARLKAHFLTCFLALLVYRILEKKLGEGYTCEEILGTLKEMNFARTDYQFITRQKMRGDPKKKQGQRINYYISFLKFKSL